MSLWSGSIEGPSGVRLNVEADEFHAFTALVDTTRDRDTYRSFIGDAKVFVLVSGHDERLPAALDAFSKAIGSPA